MKSVKILLFALPLGLLLLPADSAQVQVKATPGESDSIFHTMPFRLECVKNIMAEQ